MNIFLDDVRNVEEMGYMDNAAIYFQNEFKVVRNNREFVKLLDSATEKIEIISFDHDLCPAHYIDLEEAAKNPFGTGQEAFYHFINWITRKGIKYNIKIIFHTMNYHGLEAMVALFKRKTWLTNVELIHTTPIRYLAR